ncbi:MAG: GNAT family N-acetyltransferase [Terracidiphilus sp.]
MNPDNLTAAEAKIDVAVRKASGEDQQQLFDFWRRELPGGERVCELFTWRQASAAASGGNAPYLAEYGGEIVGVSNTIPLLVGCRGSRVCAVWQVDVVVSSAMRGRGIARQLMQQLSCAPLALGKSTQSMYEAKKKCGFSDAPNSNLLLCPLKPFYPEGTLARRLKYAAVWASSMWRRESSGLNPELCSSEVVEFGAEFDALAEKLMAGDALTPWKPAAYLNWRYRGCPDRSYRALRLDDGSGLRGTVVLRGPEGAGREAWIVDVLAEPADAETLSALIHAAQNDLKARGASVVWIHATSHRVRRQLYNSGFIDTGRTVRFTYKANGKMPADLATTEWNFFHGDGDGELYSDTE